MTKKEKMRDLICAGLNEIIKLEKLDLNSEEDVEGYYFCELFGKSSKIIWRGIGYGEIRITIWWGIKEKCVDSEATRPLNKHLIDALDVCCSAWLERRTGKWIQGRGGNSIFDTYCVRKAEAELRNIPVVQCIGYKNEGKFFL
ncbi:MAG: hypothetical protein SVR94_12395 [Pseudomonadota bacterium]|nr:hypothetical protein [Pseudomonadota bacterium]